MQGFAIFELKLLFLNSLKSIDCKGTFLLFLIETHKLPIYFLFFMGFKTSHSWDL